MVRPPRRVGQVVTGGISPYVRVMKEILISALLALMAFAGPAHGADPLKGLQSKKRPVLLFSKSRSDAALDRQVDLFRDYRPDLRERNIIVLSTTSREETRSAIGYTPINRGAARELLKRFTPADRGLTVILIDLDGTEKARWQSVVEPQEIFDLIDSAQQPDDTVSNNTENG